MVCKSSLTPRPSGRGRSPVGLAVDCAGEAGAGRGAGPAGPGRSAEHRPARRRRGAGCPRQQGGSPTRSPARQRRRPLSCRLPVPALLQGNKPARAARGGDPPSSPCPKETATRRCSQSRAAAFRTPAPAWRPHARRVGERGGRAGPGVAPRGSCRSSRLQAQPARRQPRQRSLCTISEDS